ncbi:MAG: hypothetical protein IT371_15545 [Deltaproteobacteria bacterium]|nr:hypothetical protein [Deltaproteobacteria bacterium]
MRRLRALALPAALSAALLGSCVPELALEGAPCPCGSGYQCCATTGRCVAEGDSCSSHYPSSSKRPCERDDGCPAGEACHAWRVLEDDASALLGPKECRTRCSSAHPCAPGEVCRLGLHDGRATGALQLALLCTPQKEAAGCPATECTSCGGAQPGSTFCQGSELHGCLVSAHPLCGVTCQRTKLASCYRCSETPGGAACEPPPTGIYALCRGYPCAECPKEGAACAGEVLRTCLRAQVAEVPCRELCLPVELGRCARGCVPGAKGAAATCAP